METASASVQAIPNFRIAAIRPERTPRPVGSAGDERTCGGSRAGPASATRSPWRTSSPRAKYLIGDPAAPDASVASGAAEKTASIGIRVNRSVLLAKVDLHRTVLPGNH